MFFLMFFQLNFLRLEWSRIRKTALFLMSHRLKKYKNLHPWSFTNGAEIGKCWKSPMFEGKLGVFISYLNQMKTVSMFYNSSYSSSFYGLFLPFFVLEKFKFKYDKFFVRHTVSISKFEWFEQAWHQKTFVTCDFWPFKGVGAESNKKGKFVTKIVFQIMLNKVLESCKNDISLI